MHKLGRPSRPCKGGLDPAGAVSRYGVMDEMTQPIVIAQLDPPHAGREGDWHYRTFAPGRALAALPGVHVISLDGSHRRKEAILRHADVLVLNSVVDPDLLPVLAERRGRGQVTIY